MVNYSPRFSVSGMTGTFPDTVIAGLDTVTGTDGPPTENNIQSNQQGVGNAPGTGGDFDVTYTMQTGAMRYAPMPKLAPTKITAKNPKPIYPTSAVKYAATFLPIPVQKTTITESFTFSVNSAENTVGTRIAYKISGLIDFPQVKAAAQPTDDAMQKFLNRWKD